MSVPPVPAAIASAIKEVERRFGAAGLDAVATFLEALSDTTGLAQHVGARREVWSGARQVARWVREAVARAMARSA